MELLRDDAELTRYNAQIRKFYDQSTSRGVFNIVAKASELTNENFAPQGGGIYWNVRLTLYCVAVVETDAEGELLHAAIQRLESIAYSLCEDPTQLNTEQLEADWCEIEPSFDLFGEGGESTSGRAVSIRVHLHAE